jgi:hypothetical protein
MAESGFEAVWQRLQAQLAPGTTVRNWTALKGTLGDEMTVVQVGWNRIVVSAPNAKMEQSVPKEDFRKVWGMWRDYKAGRVQRQEIMEVTRFSKYIISILHWMEER